MGRCSPEKKRVKRKKQGKKANAIRKILDHNQQKCRPDANRNSLDYSQQISTDFTRDKVLGVDTEVLEMHIGDSYQEEDEVNGLPTPTEEYNHDYLKVDCYHHQLSEERWKRKETTYNCEKKVHSIRNFYKNIALCPTRTGRIARAAMLKSQTARQFLDDTMTEMYKRKISQLYNEQSGKGFVC